MKKTINKYKTGTLKAQTLYENLRKEDLVAGPGPHGPGFIVPVSSTMNLSVAFPVDNPRTPGYVELMVTQNDISYGNPILFNPKNLAREIKRLREVNGYKMSS